MGADTVSAAELAPYLAGPGSAVVCLLLVGVGGYRFAVSYLVPLLEGTVARHMAELERANARHEAAVTAHLSHISGMGERYDRLAAQHADEHRAILEAVGGIGAQIDRLADRETR